MKSKGINEQIEAAGNKTELSMLRMDGSRQVQASSKTLRKRARLVKAAERRLE